MKSANLGLALAIGSPLAFSASNIGIRFITEHITIFDLLFLRGCFGLAATLAAARFLKKSLWGKNGAVLSLIGVSAFFSAACLATTITLLPLYQALVLLYLFPTWAIFLSILINKEKARLRDALTVVLALGGCILLVWPDEAAGLTFQKWHLIGIMGGFFYALAYVLTRRLGEANSGGLQPLFHYSLYCVLGALPLSLLFGADSGLDAPLEIVAGLALGGLTALGQVLGYAALRWLPAFTVGVIGSLELLLGALASFFLFSDPMNARGLAGGLIIITVALWPRKP